jgi:hypothetical protein
MILKFAEDTGGLLWSAYYDGPGNGYDTANCVREGSAGEVIVSGFTTGTGTGWDATTIALDPVDNSLLWEDSFDAGDGRTEEGSAIAVSSLDDVYVVGYGYGLQTDQDLLSLRYHLETAAAPESPLLADRFLSVSPNPASSGAMLAFDMHVRTQAILTIHDPSGRRIATLQEAPLGAGALRLDWDGRDSHGRMLPAGVYIARLEENGTRVCTKFVLTR